MGKENRKEDGREGGPCSVDIDVKKRQKSDNPNYREPTHLPLMSLFSCMHIILKRERGRDIPPDCPP